MIDNIRARVFRKSNPDIYTKAVQIGQEWAHFGALPDDEARHIRTDEYCILYKAKAGGIFPAHKHEQRETGIIISGKCRITTHTGEDWVATASDPYAIEADVWHTFEFLEDTQLFLMFHPNPGDWRGEIEA